MNLMNEVNCDKRCVCYFFYLNLWLNEWNDWINGKNFNMGYVDKDLFNGKC